MTSSTEAQNGLSPREDTTIPDKDTTAQYARLDDLKAQATLKYSIKDYDAAAELYSEATELQAELNGEMSAQNANLLYAYGRCLYHVAVKNSDVLGSKIAGEKQEDGSSRPKTKRATQEDGTAITKVVEEKEGPIDPTKASGRETKPLFQFTGDENFDDSGEEDEDGGDAQDGEAEEEEDDDFGNAYEVLDLARVLLLKRLEEAQASEGKGKGKEPSPAVKELKELLADTYDLQAEISLEGERFPNAVVDLKAALELKEELFPQESSLIAEAHYKLSLALEFSSVTQQKNENGEVADGGEASVDEAMREDAVQEMEAAIASCKLRIHKEEANLKSNSNGQDKPKVAQADINEVKEMVSDMEQRLTELRQPPVSINDPRGTGSIDGANPLSGILGSILGESAAAQKVRLEDASKNANDLTGLVKRKKASNAPSPQPTTSEAPRTNGKRKVEFDEEVVEVGTGKKAKLEDGEED